MLSVVKSYLQVKLGERGAEMVEYAIVLACIAAVGAVVYGTTNDSAGSSTLHGVLLTIWNKVTTTVNTIGS